jgi:hypothetical protein
LVLIHPLIFKYCRYLLNYNLALQMQAISVFLSAAGGGRFLNEFLEIGGVLTLLEMISLLQVKEVRIVFPTSLFHDHGTLHLLSSAWEVCRATFEIWIARLTLIPNCTAS